MLYWLQAEMWGKHFAISIVFIGKWNQESPIFTTKESTAVE